ncbi:HCLS1-associated protein X-1 [Pelodytes ibericus]
MTIDEEDEDDDEAGIWDNPFSHPPRFGFGAFSGPSADPFKDMFGFKDIFRDFNELFADFGSMNGQIPDFSGIDSLPRSSEDSGRRSLRDFMLKTPDSHLQTEQNPEAPAAPRLPGRLPWSEDDPVRLPQGDAKRDRDLDSEVSSKGLEAILTPSKPRSSSYFQSVSVSRVTRPDGTTEERRTVRDGSGNTHSTVTVRRGDQIISSTTE